MKTIQCLPQRLKQLLAYIYFFTIVEGPMYLTKSKNVDFSLRFVINGTCHQIILPIFFYPTVGPYIPPKELYNNGQDWETQTNLTEFAVNILKWYYWNQIWGGG